MNSPIQTDNQTSSILKTALVVDDNSVLSGLWSRALRQEGFTVVVAANGREALEKMSSNEFSVIFTDMNMPTLGGIEFLRLVKSKGIQSCVNVITGLASVENAVECMRLGACDFVGKPFDLKELTAMAYRCFRHYSQAQESQRLQKTVVHLEEINRLKSEFVSNVSHELRTPLFAMGTALDLIMEDIQKGLDDPKKKLCDIVHVNYKRLSDLIKQILDFSKIEQGQLRPVFKTMDLGVTARDMFESLTPLMSKRDIEAKCDLPPEGTAVVQADPDHVSQILVNLLGNACKFTRIGGLVNLSLQEKPKGWLMAVTDTGVGISQQHLPRIFDRFYQVDGSMTREAGGTGIGLSITKAMTEMHGGEIWVESELGKGSTFFVFLPKSPHSEGGTNHANGH